MKDPGPRQETEEPTPQAKEPETQRVGPLTPQGSGVPAPPPELRLPRVDVERASEVWLVGAHGGAGETTLEALVPGTRSSGHAWPQADGDAPRVVLVSRTHASGLAAAQHALIEWASGTTNVELLGIVFVADGPKIPRALQDERRRVAGGAPRSWMLEWSEAWRSDAPSVSTAPRASRKALTALAALVSADHTQPTSNPRGR